MWQDGKVQLEEKSSFADDLNKAIADSAAHSRQLEHSLAREQGRCEMLEQRVSKAEAAAAQEAAAIIQLKTELAAAANRADAAEHDIKQVQKSLDGEKKRRADAYEREKEAMADAMQERGRREVITVGAVVAVGGVLDVVEWLRWCLRLCGVSRKRSTNWLTNKVKWLRCRSSWMLSLSPAARRKSGESRRTLQWLLLRSNWQQRSKPLC